MYLLLLLLVLMLRVLLLQALLCWRKVAGRALRRHSCMACLPTGDAMLGASPSVTAG